ncbi:MAG: (d)CMP kinase, partial [Bacteroidota bacterium]
SQVSTVKEVRLKLVKLQRRMAETRGVVMDGRDIGTVVLPDAELKIFMTADPEVRAKRRYDELIGKGIAVSMHEVLENVKTRDHIDSTREIDPLKQSPEAIVVDNTELTIDEQFQFILGHVERLVSEPVQE